jgi:hypothetical protein
MKGWTQRRARDNYDLRRILKKHGKELDTGTFSRLLKDRCKVRGVDFRTVEDFFTNELVAEIDERGE